MRGRTVQYFVMTTATFSGQLQLGDTSSLPERREGRLRRHSAVNNKTQRRRGGVDDFKEEREIDAGESESSEAPDGCRRKATETD